MHRAVAERAGIVGVAALLLAAPALAQYREYYVRGKVLDSAKAPIADVEIELRDTETSRAYHMKTDKEGVFKLAGLPHGVYAVSVSKPGYASKQDEWKLDAPQTSMKRVEMPDVILTSQAQVEQTQRLQEAGERNKSAAEKVRRSDFDGAVTELKEVLRKNPDDTDALFLLGLSYSGKQMWTEAVEALTRVTQLSPSFPGAYFQLAVCEGKLGNAEKALDYYDKHLELEPSNADSAYNSGLILFEENRIDEALARFEIGLGTRPDDPELHEMAGRCYVHQGKLQEAVDHLERARAVTTDADKLAFLDALIRDAKSLIR